MHLLGFDLSMLELCAACGALVFDKDRRFLDLLSGAPHAPALGPTRGAEWRARHALAQAKRDDLILSALGAALRAPGMLEFDKKALRWAIKEMPEPPDMEALRLGVVPPAAHPVRKPPRQWSQETEPINAAR